MIKDKLFPPRLFEVTEFLPYSKLRTIRTFSKTYNSAARETAEVEYIHYSHDIDHNTKEFFTGGGRRFFVTEIH